MVSPQHSDIDGKVWTQNNGFAGVHRLDIASGKIETWMPFKDARKGEPHNIYDVIPDSHNNAFFTDFRQGQIGRIDAKSGEGRAIPDADASLGTAARQHGRTGPASGSANIAATGSGCSTRRRKSFRSGSSTRAGRRRMMSCSTRPSTPGPGRWLTDQVTRLNTKTGEMADYLLPRTTNIRRVFVDNATTPVSFWIGSNDGASIVKVEALELRMFVIARSAATTQSISPMW